MRKGRPTIGIVLAVIGVILVAGSFLWRVVGVPALVKYPADLDVAPEYAGTVRLFVDPATQAPLNPPRDVPLTVKRSIKVVESSGDRAVVAETVAFDARGAFTGTQRHQYVIDRREMVNVADERSWAFSETNRVDRSGSYRVQFPLHTASEPITVYKNEIAATYQATPSEGGPAEVEGMAVVNFAAQSGYAPAAPAYLASLRESVDLPVSLTLAQLTPLLATQGIDLTAQLVPLLAKVQPEDAQTLAGLAAQPIALQYVTKFSGSDSVEATTGSILQVRDVVETMAAAPEPAVVQTIVTVLDKYPDLAEAKEARASIDKLAANPLPIFENRFSQTPASVSAIAADVKRLKGQVGLAENTVPTLLLVGGLVLLVAGVVLVVLANRRAAGAAGSLAAPPPPPATV